MSPARANATRADIVALLNDGHSIGYIARHLHIDRARARTIRNELGYPAYVRGARTLEQRWQQHATPAADGHMEWTGERNTHGRPLISYRARHRSASAVAFRIRTGRDPIGQALADCGMRHCVAPDHVDDAPGRRRTREQLRFLQGRQPVPEECGNGNDQEVHARIGGDGISYCNTCKRTRERTRKAAA